MQTLTGPILKEMILESYNRINQKIDYLNDINVFPVPDGDTGINLYLTMEKVVEELQKSDIDVTIRDAAKAISKGAFIGAKGNSGVILSQFFVGFAKTIESEEVITTEVFANAMLAGSNRAYKAVMNPREGTILSVLRETSQAAVDKTKQGADWKEVVEHCYKIAQQSTLETPDLLQDLKNAGVVDAGALGFVYLIQGWLFVIANIYHGPKVIDVREDLENLHNNIDVESTVENLVYRYCTEALLTDNNEDLAYLRSEMQNFGDSFLLIENEGSIKLHVHSNKPSSTIKRFSEFGKLIQAKIDDMKTQTENSHQ